MLLLATLVILFMAGDAVAQTVAGPDANPLPRMNCPTAGEIRNDSGNCVPVASYFSTASNKIKWVDGTNGSDSNAGTQSNPWKTISRSTGEGVLQPGDAVIIRGGTYRESIAPQEAGVAGKQIAFVAFPGEEVIITGADPMNSGWTQSGNAWRHTWTESMPAEPNVGTLEERPEFRREMVIIDGQVLTPVFARSSVVPGTFYVEGTDVDPEAIYMRLPDDDSPSGHSVEVGYRSALFLPHGSREDWCGNNYGHYRLVGLTFRHAVNNASWAAVCTGKASLLEENTIEWTNGSGIYVAGSNNVLRGNRADYNGMRGIGGRCASCLLEYNETSYNNWKKHAYGYGAAGIKLIYSTQTVIGHHLSVGNDGVGIWYDVNNEDCVIESSVSMWNAGRGIMLEHGTVRTVVRNNVVYGTKLHPKEGTGIQTQAASHNTIVHNTIIGNEGYGIYIRVSPRNEDGYNKIYNNLLINNAAGGKSGHSEIRIDGIDLAHARTNDLDGNLYWPHAGISGSTFNFKTDAGDSFQGNSIDKWRTLIQGDAGASVLNDDVKQIEDMGSWSGWGLVTSSEAIGRGVALPSGIEVPIDIEGQDRPSILADVGADQYAESDGGGVIEGTLVENGSISFVQSSPDEWHTVKLKSVFVSPVVVMSPPSYNGGNPSTVRVRNVSSNSFEFQLDEWDYLDGSHMREDVHYVVFEAGRHNLGNGHEVEAGIVNGGSSFASVSFKQSFADTPVVFSQIVSTNDAGAAVTRQRNVTSAGFEVMVQGEQASPSHGDEQVAYVAITQGHGEIGTQSFSAELTSSGVNHQFSALDFGQSYSTAPMVLASMQSANGMQTATLRHQNLDGSGMEVKVEEEQSLDAETSHVNEAVGFLAITGGTDHDLVSDSEDGEVVASELIENGSISVDQSSPDEWHTVELKNVFVSPVVVMSPPSYNGGNPSTVRVRNVSSNSFEFQLDEWNYLDGKHMREDVHYVVFEAGRHNLGNGHEAEAGIVNGGSSFASVSFKQSFADTPVVFSQIVSTNDAGAAVTRQRNVTSAGFEVMVQGEQASPSHGGEKVAYVAITQGHGEIGTQSFSAGLTSSGVNHQFSALDFGQSYSTAPMVLASMQSANGMHTATLRYQNLDGSGMEVKVEEEQSLDAETYHVKETIGYLAIDGGSDISLAKTSTGVDHGSAVLADGLPKTVELVGNYPNPFNPTTTIQYALPEGAYVRLEVFDVTGRSVSVVVDGVQSAGVHEARFDASGLASGLYMYRLETGAFTKTSPMILMK